MSELQSSVRDLRRLWKPHKERLSEDDPEHPTNIRFHRACSWLRRAEQATEESDLDSALLSQWIAFNALYGQWDQAARAPLADRACWEQFVDRILALDGSDYVPSVLSDNKRLVMSIFDDEFLSRYFWQEPSGKRAGQSKKTMYDARTWYLQGKWALILDRVLERIYLLRCQLTHGAATFNSSLNRTASRRCSTMMDHLLRAFLLVWINHGVNEDWGVMCYPPLRKTSSRR
ncbi:HEPN domain-containing protein [Thalassoroseus pseudoceratinae]|uniref:HEPN domain-containing protein n=1 Tax=Thalassoroseus pseudoceratinae TaxID=2713176 RepID=UPI001424522A|nr:HEPN domain-containing protein [Thalassoroseus pseudoceratinae]